ncbi:MAG: hypothetical protein ACREUV_07940 [Burkholderiales bacterium]
MKFKTAYEKLELGAGIAAFCAGLALLVLTQVPLSVWIPDVFKWAGVALLLQSLMRDLYLLTFQRALLQKTSGAAQKAPWICLESTLGIVLMLIYALLFALDTRGEAMLSAAQVVLLLSLWWLFGYGIREVVMEFKTEPNHLNLVVGFRVRKD